MTPQSVGLALLVLGFILLIGKVLRIKVHWMQSLFLPSAIIGGTVGLLAGPEVFGKIASLLGTDMFASGGLFTEDMIEVWKTLPGLLISVVFATLFLGQDLPGPKRVIELAGPQLSLGVAFASGQYVVGLLVAILVITPLFGIPYMAGALIEIGFEGGHGTAAGMFQVFEDLGWSEGGDLAIGTATVGLVGGVVIGVGLINWAVRTGRTKVVHETADRSREEEIGLFRNDEYYPAARMTARPSSIEPLSLHVAILALAIILGQLVLSGLQLLETTFWPDFKLLAYVPLFPLAMIGGIIVQLVLKWTGYDHMIDSQMMARIQGLGLDLLVTAAIATVSLKAISANLLPFLLLCVAGIAFNTFILLWFTPRCIPDYWFERGIGDFGESMGVTATGLILMRIVDPEGKSPCFEAFGYKQLVFEPFFGGGFVTALMAPLIFKFGPWPPLIGMAVLFVIALTTGLFYWGKDIDQKKLKASYKKNVAK
ncbi:sodium/glutamate symporter [Gleimia hominis]|uniref:sodium/glutamate symporter n=1 Tax=Gleimia hominis TaxID=595468 RepID=UPI000C7FE5B8|nr:sodium/glutamate symporter [Gleimia hominis]WIK64384.1 sodium/glutamate symporter [Gleimia hominis]